MTRQPDVYTTLGQQCGCCGHRHASWKERKELARALRAIYGAASAEAAAAELERFEAGPYGKRFAVVADIWRRRWEEIMLVGSRQSLARRTSPSSSP